MVITCPYNTELDLFFKQLVNECIENYCSDLTLDHLRKIELIEMSHYPNEGDAHFFFDEKKIIINSRLLNLFPTHDIKKLSENDDFKQFIYSICHELYHVSDSVTYPNLYSIVSSTTNLWEILSTLFWLEYLVEQKCHKRIGKTNCDLYDQFESINFCCTEFNTETCDTSNFFYLTKLLSYFVATIMWEKDGEKRLNNVKDRLLHDYIEELADELSKLDKLNSFDDPTQLYDLQKIMKKYCNKSTEKYTLFY